MGGTLAMMIAARHPAAVGRVMVVDMLPAPAGLLGSSAEALRPLADALARVLTSSPGGRQLLHTPVRGFRPSNDAPRSATHVVARPTHPPPPLHLTPHPPPTPPPPPPPPANPPPGRRP